MYTKFSLGNSWIETTIWRIIDFRFVYLDIILSSYENIPIEYKVWWFWRKIFQWYRMRYEYLEVYLRMNLKSNSCPLKKYFRNTHAICRWLFITIQCNLHFIKGPYLDVCSSCDVTKQNYPCWIWMSVCHKHWNMSDG